MVKAWRSCDGSEARILARGNFSLGAGGLVNLLLALAAVTLSLAGFLAWQGYWPVLLIALIQIILVSWILVRAWQNTWVSELIEIDAEKISVTQRRHHLERQIELDSAWAVVELEQPAVTRCPPTLRLRSGRTRLELGSFLTDEEKHQLLAQLKSAIKKHSALKGAFNF